MSLTPRSLLKQSPRLRSIQVRLLLTYLVLISFTTAVAYLFFLPRIRDYLEERTQDHLVSESRVLGNLIAGNYRYSDANLALVADDLRLQFRNVSGIRVRLYDPEGTLVLDSRDDAPQTMPQRSPPGAESADRVGEPAPEVLRALLGEQVTWGGGTPRPGDGTSGRTVHVSSPLKAAGRVFGVVDISSPVNDREMVRDVRNIVGLALFVSALASWGVAFVLSRTIVGPIERIRVAADRIAGGNLSHRVRTGQDELGRLGLAINHMAAELERRIIEIVGQKNTMNSLLATLLDGVVALDRDNRVHFLNRVAETLLRTRSGEAIGRPVVDLIRDADLTPMLAECLQKKHLVSQETFFGDRILKLYFLPYEDERHQHLGTMMVMHDVTDLRRLEEVRAQFFGSVSHELRTPLTIIKGFASTQLNSELVKTDPVMRRSLEMIDRETDRLARLVDDILELSRCRSNKMSMERKPVPADSIVRETMEPMQAHAVRAGVSLHQTIAEPPTIIMADPDRFKQIVLNLVDNAVKYTPVGGDVHVRTECDAGCWRLVVQDSGVGIPAEELPFLFERFFRGRDARRKGSSLGTGLGLAIVRELVDAHDGEIAVESELGKGSTVRVSFPVHP